MKIRFTSYLTLLLFSLGGCQPKESEQSTLQEQSTKIDQAPRLDNAPPLDANTSKSSLSEFGTISTQAALQKSPSKASQDNTKLEPQSSIDGDKLIEAIGFANSEDSLNLPSQDLKSMPASCINSSSLNSSEIKAARSNFCTKIGDRLASVSKLSCNTAGLRPSGCQSVSGTPLMIREFPPIKGKPPLGRVLVIGGTHGDELTSVSVVFRWLGTLKKFHSGLFHWHVVPVMNPDGLLKRGAQRTNNNGVDLNRNLPSSDWEQNAISYWQQKNGRDPRKFPGKRPTSEPETQWLVDEIKLFRPDAIIAVHAPYGVVDFDAQQLNTAPKSLGKLHLNLLGTYPGSLGNYAGINLNIPVITLELPHAWDMPSEDDTDKIWEDIVSWLKVNVTTDNVTAAD